MIRQVDIERGMLKQEPLDRGSIIAKRSTHDLLKGNASKLEMALGINRRSDCPRIKPMARGQREPIPRNRLKRRDTRPAQDLLHPLKVRQAA